MQKDNIVLLFNQDNSLLFTKNLNDVQLNSQMDYSSVLKSTFKDYEFISSQNENLGYTLIVGTPEQYFKNQILPLKLMIFRYIVLVIATVIILSILFTYKSVHPLNELLNYVTTLGVKDKKHYKNEYDYLQYSIDQMHASNTDFAAQIKQIESSLNITSLERIFLGFDTFFIFKFSKEIAF